MSLSQAISADMVARIIAGNESGHSNKAIASMVGCSRPTVAKTLRSHGLVSPRRTPQALEYLTQDSAKCSECFEVQPISAFSILVNGAIPYRRSYCNRCLNRRNCLTLNGDMTRFLRLRLQQVKNRASGKGLLFQIDLPWTLTRLEKQGGLCFYTDAPLEIAAGIGRGKGDRDKSLSFDRVKNEDGYLPGNVVLAATRINHMKSNATMDEMAKWMPEWHKRATKFLEEEKHVTTH